MSEQSGGFFAKRRARKAAEAYQKSLHDWETNLSNAQQCLQLAQTFAGESADSSTLMLKGGETLFATVTEASLVEDRKGAGHWEGKSHGVSIPIGSLGGRSVRYRVGASKGHFIQGAPVATAIDTGTITVTNQRLVFQGQRQTRECAFAKTLGYQFSADLGQLTVSVSNRQKATVLAYGAGIGGWFALRFELAMAHFQGKVPDLVQQLQSELIKIQAAKPQLGAGPP